MAAAASGGGAILYQGYAYGYPHKFAYRPLTPARPLREVWANEPRDSLFLYVHLPFCEMRCGFCNLFTTANPQSTLVSDYLMALRNQVLQTAQALSPGGAPTCQAPRFTRAALGGGTPTYLSVPETEALFATLESAFGPLHTVPWSIEMSPATVTEDKLKLFMQKGMYRASIGVQSFDPTETAALGRRQDSTQLHEALTLMRQSGVPVLNIDLIYGIDRQTPRSWLHTLARAMEYRPEEIFLYPLYVRPLTGLGRRSRKGAGGAKGDMRFTLYALAHQYLTAQGYRRVSMRLFRRRDVPDPSGPHYCCQEDGMLGLGAGARSYTRALHYSSEYAVGRPDVQAILARYIEEFVTGATSSDIISKADREPEPLARFGAALPLHEQQRRYVIKSLLRCDGLDPTAFRHQYGCEVLEALPQVAVLQELGLAEHHADGAATTLRLTSAGMDLSDVIGPWLYSLEIQQLTAEYELS
ncbi:coproporphyrinogen III oxidase family protein [Verrucomicrobia bacterium LW23]|nr:coproporphyrinogen III oxidase family protein [Verrucomicrobia bacterium LW23]